MSLFIIFSKKKFESMTFNSVYLVKNLSIVGNIDEKVDL